ncbi:glycosyltransferase family 2 protein [Patulibacter sp.]|uniref:glycosyltransferase family 2 protein n=1 Tax=Patulibacter sp. TaxID=1912859 RepID=UPI0027233A1A|nr:glycosyltransferase family 2 protein [Patulibacter sp.]MDO9408629.1 glycosyltransferase family 2 protein [Patulibacter sp.]
MSAPFLVVVVSYRTPELLDRCLTSLGPELDAGRASVVVVDNAPGDGSAELVRGRHPAVGLVEPGTNLGFGAAVDLGARGSDAAWICPANADVAVRPGALEALLRAGEADPDAGILAPRLVAPDGTTQHSVHPFPGLRFTAAFNAGLTQRSDAARRRHVLEGSWDPDAGRRVPWAHGAFLAIRRGTWDAIGGFDPAMWMYAEDLDVCWRAARAGAATRYVPEAHVDHEIAAATTGAFGDDRARRFMAATYAWQASRRSPAVAAATAALNVAGAAGRAVLGAPPGRAAHRAWTRDHLLGARDGLSRRGR